MKWIILIALCGLCACGVLSHDQAATLSQYFSEQRAQGLITEAQYQTLIEALDTSGFDWEQLLWTAGGVIGALFGVRIQRGPPALPAEKLARVLAKIQENAGVAATTTVTSEVKPAKS